jgi:6-phosphogluconolactonase (cycloisomerase 2 family)
VIRRPVRSLAWSAAALLLPALAVAVGVPRGAGDAPASGAPIGFLYVNEGTRDRDGGDPANVVSGLAAHADGSLAVLPGSPWPTGGRGPTESAFIAAPRLGICALGRRLYVVDQGSDDLAAFAIGGDGGLGPVPGSPFPSGGDTPQGVAVTPDGRFLFVGHTGSRSIVPFAIDPGGAELTRVAAPLVLDSAPDGLAVTPDGRHLVATLPLLARIAVLAIDGAGGLAHVPGSPFRSDANTADGVAFGRGGAHLYVADSDPLHVLISLYELGPSGVPRRVAASPFSGPAGATNILALVPGGRVLAASLPAQNRLATFAVGAGGRLSSAPGSPFPNAPPGSAPTGLAADEMGRFLYVAGALSGTVSVFGVLPGGRLEAVGEGLGTGVKGFPLAGLAFVPAGDADADGVPAGADNCPAAANPSQADADGDGVGDACDGCSLVPDSGQRDADGDGIGDACDADRDGDGSPDALDLCPDIATGGQADGDGDGVGDPCDDCPGAADPGQEDADGDGVGDACDPPFVPIGRLYVMTNAPENSIAGWEVDHLGRLRRLAGSPFPTGGDGSLALTFYGSPSLALGRFAQPFLFASNEGSDTVSVLKILPDGTLAAIPQSPFRTGGEAPAGLALHPRGSPLAVANNRTYNITLFRVSPEDGRLEIVNGTPAVVSGRRVDGIVWAPSGLFLEMSVPEPGNVVAVNEGLLPIAGSSRFFDAGGVPAGLAFNAAGDRIYLATSSSGPSIVGAFAIDAAAHVTRLPRSPASGGGLNSNVAVPVPGGRLLYVSNQGSNTIAGLRVDPSGSLSPLPGTPFPNAPQGEVPAGMATDPSGRFLFAANERTGNVSAFRIQHDGSLLPLGEAEATGAVQARPLGGVLFVGCCDEDGDGIAFEADNCPAIANPDQRDGDGDRVGDACDDCVTLPNAGQEDADGDGQGNLCDPDPDGDGLPGAGDDCPNDADPDQIDADGDGLGDPCDRCPADRLNDADHDGACAGEDNCPATVNPDQDDFDHDLVGDACDGCPSNYNPDQADGDGNGQGDACQIGAGAEGLLYLNGLSALNRVAGFETKIGGGLLGLPGTPYPTGGSGRHGDPAATAAPGLAFARRGPALFVLNPDSRDVGAVLPDTRGALRPAAGSPFATGLDLPTALLADPAGETLYVAGGRGGAGTIRTFAISRTGRLTALEAEPPPLVGLPEGLSMAPDGSLLAAALPDAGTVALFAVGEAGSLVAVPGWPAPVPGIVRPGPIAFLPRGGAPAIAGDPWLLAAGEAPPGAAALAVVTAAAGGPRPHAAFPLGISGGTLAIAPDPTRDRLFLSLTGGDAIAVIEGARHGTPAHAPGSPAPLPDGSRGPAGLAVGVEGRSLFAANRATNTLTPFRVAEDGRLTPVPGPQVATGIAAATPSAGLLHVPNVDDDGDDLNDLRDNCPAVANSGQEDTNRDGAGDACQPTARIEAVVVAERAATGGTDGGGAGSVPALAADARIGDPNGQPLRGRVVVTRRETRSLTLLDAGLSPEASDGVDCRRGLPFEVRPPGEGIAYMNSSAGEPILVDEDLFFGCNDQRQDYELAVGPCDGPGLGFGSLLTLSALPLPADLCARSLAGPERRYALRLESIQPESADITFDADAPRVLAAYSGSLLPGPIALDPVGPPASDPAGVALTLTVSATDGETPEVFDRMPFVWRGEPFLVFGRPPRAVGPGRLEVECASPELTPVDLDGGASSDPDGGPLDYAWLEDLGPAGLRPIAAGARAVAGLALGPHALILKVTDPSGLIAADRFEVEVRDTTPPEAAALAAPAILWPPDHRLVPVRVLIDARDACAGPPDVRLQFANSSEPDDAPGGGDGRTTGDIRAAAAGFDDRDLLLRAERATPGPGRTYTLTYRIVDRSGNARTLAVEVRAPHDRGDAGARSGD